MKQLIKHPSSFIKLFSLLLLLLVFNCQKDDNVTESIEPQNQLRKPPSYTANIFNGDSIINANPNLKNKLKRFNDKTALRTMQSSEHDFSIDTTRVQKIQTSSYISYTFIAVRPYPVDDVLENYVITHFNNDTYKQYFISYPIINNNGDISYDVNNALISVLNDDSLVYYRDANCVSVIAYEESVCVDFKCLSGEHTVSQGSECDYWGTSNMATRECTEGGWVDQGCSGGGNSPGGNNPGGDNNGGTAPDGPGNTNEPEPEDEIVIAMSLTLIQEIEKCINMPTMIGAPNNTTITPGLIASLNLSPAQVMALNNYLRVQNQCSEEAQEFAIKLIESYHLVPEMDKECQAEKVVSFTTRTDSPIVNIITNNFFGNSNYNLQFEDENIDSDLDGNALTIPPDGMVFNQNTYATIRFDNSYLENATDLSIVMTTAHEYVHVFLIYLYTTGDLLNYYPNYTDLNTAFQNFENNPSEDNSELLDTAMHDVYDDFLGWITQSVYAYAVNNSIEGATESYCNKLVIGAHQDTDAFQALTPTQQTEYSTITSNEEHGTEQAKGTTCD